MPPLTSVAQTDHDRMAGLPCRLPGFYLVSEAAQKARCSPWTIRKEIKEGRLRARRIGRLVRILDADLAHWMQGEVAS